MATLASLDRTINAPHQHKQPSRKRKRAWRKNVDISEIQSGLQEARDELINGGIIAEQPSEKLFTLDTTGSQAIQQEYNKKNKRLKSNEILAQRSAAPIVRNYVQPKGTTDGVIATTHMANKSNRVSAKDRERLQRIAYEKQSLSDIINPTQQIEHDPWAENEQVKLLDDPRFSFMDKVNPIRAPSTLKESPISLVAGGTKVPSVPHPREGTSYNPTFAEWDAVVAAEGAKEVEAERRRLHQAHLEEQRLERISLAEQEREREEGLQTEDESAWEGFESDYENETYLNSKRPQRKTPQERKRVERRKERERLEKHEKKMQEKQKQQRRIPEILKQHKSELAVSTVKSEGDTAEASEAAADDRQLRRRRFGKNSVPQAPLELVLPDELEDSLRLLKPEGNLLNDRFRTLMVRGKIEARKPAQYTKKKKRDFTEKWTHKDFEISV